MRYYKCTNIKTVDGTPYHSCIVSVPKIDLSEAVDRHENLEAVSAALEDLIGEIDSFSMEEVYDVEFNHAA